MTTHAFIPLLLDDLTLLRQSLHERAVGWGGTACIVCEQPRRVATAMVSIPVDVAEPDGRWLSEDENAVYLASLGRLPVVFCKCTVGGSQVHLHVAAEGEASTSDQPDLEKPVRARLAEAGLRAKFGAPMFSAIQLPSAA